MRFRRILEENIKNTSLRRVRVKVDPGQTGGQSDFTKCTSYEGYILMEGIKTIKILVLEPEMSIEDVTPDLIEYIANDESYNCVDDLKAFIIEQLIKCGRKEGDPLIQNIGNCSELDDIEVFLKQNGYDAEGINEIYRSYILDES